MNVKRTNVIKKVYNMTMWRNNQMDNDLGYCETLLKDRFLYQSNKFVTSDGSGI